MLLQLSLKSGFKAILPEKNYSQAGFIVLLLATDTDELAIGRAIHVQATSAAGTLSKASSHSHTWAEVHDDLKVVWEVCNV